MKLTAREREIVALLRADPMLDATALADRIGSTRAAVSVHLSNLMKKGVVLGRGYVLRAEADSVVVVGGAVLDTKVRTSGPPVLATSNPGTASWTAGGVGRNIAENLARLGSPTLLVAAVGDDPAAETVLARTTSAGVECRHVVTSAHPTGTYAAVLDERGDLLVAVADMRATDELTASDLEVVPSLLGGADAIVVDANLDAGVVRWLLSAAEEAGVVAVLEPVSVAKATEMAPVLDGSVRAHTVTPNVGELAALVGRAVPDTVDGVVRAARELHARGVEHVWVRRGMRGSLLSIALSPDGSGAARPVGGTERTGDGTASGSRVVLVGAPPVEVADVTGAGDAMTAGYVHALLAGEDVVEAAR
ncbi:MAG TPA: carbohydrate kinase, partial [Ornithinibacter sp.]|nr:carbohydrate kinase [Ornithinibacter sp.]